MPSNGDWSQSQKLVMEMLRQHGKKLDRMEDQIEQSAKAIAVLTDREQRAEQAAKSIAVRWGTAFGALVSTLIATLFAMFRNTP
jgi:hypothetical protein